MAGIFEGLSYEQWGKRNTAHDRLITWQQDGTFEKMKRQPKKLLKINILLIIAIFPLTAWTDINIRAYYGVEERINKDYHYLNPLWGQALIDSSVLFDLRFYGPKDTSLIKRLFPLAAALGTTTIATNNFARNVNNTKVIAYLLKMAHDERSLINNKNNLDMAKKIKAAHKATSSGLATFLSWDGNDGQKKRKDIMNPLLSDIKASVALENDNGFYPTYFTESLLLAFFVKKFNNQTDIWNLLKEINQVFGQEIAFNIPNEEKLLTTNDIDSLYAQMQKGPLNLEGAFNMLNADIFTNITPYRDQKPLIENETVYAFNRATDEIDFSLQSADCAETVIRHVLNLLFYDPLTKSFKLNHSASAQNSRIYRYLVNFYQLQPPKRANDSSKEIRIAWNKVNADLNQEGDLIKVRYVKANNNEIYTGFINFIVVLQKIFNITLKDLPESKDAQKTWLTEALPKLFSAVNPLYIYKVDHKIDPIQPGDKDLYGTIKVTVSNDNSQKFSFTMTQSRDHAKVADIKTLDEEAIKQNLKFKAYQSTLKESDIFAKLRPYQDSLLLIGGKEAKHEPFITFFKNLDSNEGRISWLEEIACRTFNGVMLSNTIFLARVLDAMSWNDENTVGNLSNVIRNFLKFHLYQEIVIEHTQGLKLSSLILEKIPLSKFPNLKYLYLSSSFGEDINKITSQDLPASLEMLDARSSNVNELSLSDLPNLKNIDLSESDIAILTLGNLPKLEHLNLSHTLALKSLSLSNLPNLTYFDLSQSGITTLTLENLSKLEWLNLSHTLALKTLSLSSLPNLKYLNFFYSGITNLQLGNLVKLKQLNLDETSALRSLSLSNLPNLTYLDLSQSGITILTLGNLPKLEQLNLSKTPALKVLLFSGALSKLKILNLKSSGITTLELRDNLPELEELDISHTPNLKTLWLRDLPKIKYLNFSPFSCITMLRLENLKQLEQLNFSRMPALKVLLLGYLPKIKRLNLDYSSIIQGAKNLKLSDDDIRERIKNGSLVIEQ
jgi:hypothetical protein